MKNINKFKQHSAIALLAAILCIPTANAEREVGSGGDGVLRGNRVYSLDLVEAGAEIQPSLPGIETADPDVVEALRSALDETKFPIHQIAAKITEIEAIHPIYAWAIIRGISVMNWAVVDPALINVRDEETVVNIPPGRLVQVAVRRNGVVRINRRWWNMMDSANKAALIFHEVNYAYMIPETVTRRIDGWQRCYTACGTSESCRTSCLETHQETVSRQESFPSRDLTGYLFQRPLLAQGQEALYRRIPRNSYLTSATLGRDPNYSLGANDMRADVIRAPSFIRIHSLYLGSLEIERNAVTQVSVQSYCQNWFNTSGVGAVDIYIDVPGVWSGLNTNESLYLGPSFGQQQKRTISGTGQARVDSCVAAIMSMKEEL